MRALLVVAVAVVGCGPARLPGAPEVGKACTDEVPECSSTASISICEGGRWADYDCAGGCSNAQEPRCREAGAQVGDPCPASSEFHGYCAGDTIIQCTDGKWVEARTCPPGLCVNVSGHQRASCRSP